MNLDGVRLEFGFCLSLERYNSVLLLTEILDHSDVMFKRYSMLKLAEMAVIWQLQQNNCQIANFNIE